MPHSTIIVAAGAATLEQSPFPSDWVLAGTPEARSKMLAKSHDGTACIVVWECTAGRFIWHYPEDETSIIISGEVFITDDKGEERRLIQGHVAFFPAGSSCTWRVTDCIKKVAVLRKDLPRPFGIGLRAWHKFLRIAGLRAHHRSRRFKLEARRRPTEVTTRWQDKFPAG